MKCFISVFVGDVSQEHDDSFLSRWQFIAHLGDVLGKCDAVTFDAPNPALLMNASEKVCATTNEQLLGHGEAAELNWNVALNIFLDFCCKQALRLHLVGTTPGASCCQ